MPGESRDSIIMLQKLISSKFHLFQTSQSYTTKQNKTHTQSYGLEIIKMDHLK